MPWFRRQRQGTPKRRPCTGRWGLGGTLVKRMLPEFSHRGRYYFIPQTCRLQLRHVSFFSFLLPHHPSFSPSFRNCTGSHDVPGPDFLGLTSVAWVCAKLLQLCPILCDPTDCSPPGFSVHGILQAIILEWVIISFSRGSSRPRNQTHISHVSCVGRWVLYH